MTEAMAKHPSGSLHADAGTDPRAPVPTRRRFLQTAAAAPMAAHAAPVPPPNVVLILTDDQGYGDVGCLGNTRIHTPNMDRIAREGVQFTRFHVSPVCAPTRASLMTGRYNYRTCVTDTYLGRAMMHPDEVTIAQVFRNAGYRTGIFGKWHLGDNYPMRATDRGWDTSIVHRGGGLSQPAGEFNERYFNPVLLYDGVPRQATGYCTDIYTRDAIEFIEQNRHRPFFTYLATNAPHSPPDVDQRWAAPYRAAGFNDWDSKIYGMITNIDDNVGRLLQRLHELKLEDNTIVIFMGDNGPERPRFNAGMRGLKCSVYEGGIRVPFFLRWPGRLKPGRVDRLAAHIDVLPTLAEACGVALPKDVKLDGRSLMPLLGAGGSAAAAWPDRNLFFQWHRGDVPQPFRNACTLNQRYKLVDGKELYDLAADPAESTNIAASQPERVARMRRAYEEWFRDVSSTRGYDPPLIYLGTRFENPVRLTRQDLRGPEASWNTGEHGHWAVDVRTAGDYEVTFQFHPREIAGAASVRIAGTDARLSLDAHASTCTFSRLELKSGPAKLEAALDFSGQPAAGPEYVLVRKL